MRLNRNSLLFIAILVIIIIVAVIFLRDKDTSDEPTIDAVTDTIQIFPDVSSSDVTSLTIREVREVGDARPTPIPGNPTLEAPTPLPEGFEPEKITEIVSLNKDTVTSNWTVGDETTQSVDGTIDSTRLAQAIADLVGLQSNQQFTPTDGNYAQYGLDEPDFEILFVVGIEEPTNYILRIGNRTVGENSYYASLNEDRETIYIVNGASTLQNSILNLTNTIPLVPLPTATAVPVLNISAPFASFLLTNATSFTFSDNESEDIIEINRNEDNTAWTYTQNGEEIHVQQETLQVILNSFSTISGVNETRATDLERLGLDTPNYLFEARMVDGTTYTLQIGDVDPAGTVYYSLVDDFESVVLIDSDSTGLLISLFVNPPILVPEATPEATEES